MRVYLHVSQSVTIVYEGVPTCITVAASVVGGTSTVVFPSIVEGEAGSKATGVGSTGVDL